MTMRERFAAFLASAQKFVPEAEREQIVIDAEGMMTEFIRAKIEPAFELYVKNGAWSKGDSYLGIRQQLTSRPDWTAGVDVERLKKVLKSYADFVRSKAFTENKATLSEREKESLKNKKKAKATERPVQDVIAETEPTEQELLEGAIRQVSFSTHERNKALRQQCLKHFGISCQACGMTFNDRYGEIGEGYIEVHHLSPISQTDGEHAVNPKKDLVPLCANCHAMIHRLMSIEKQKSGMELEGELALAKLKAIIGERV